VFVCAMCVRVWSAPECSSIPPAAARRSLSTCATLFLPRLRRGLGFRL
jgi:hypothetical protein